MTNENKLIIAPAGSGKTTFLIKEALENKGARILITTFTEANEEEIRRKFITINKCVPGNITIQTWFSFLIQHGVKPYQGYMGLQTFKCKGLYLVNSQSAPYSRESDPERHYFNANGKIFSDKLSKFIIKCNETGSNALMDRLSRIYTDIFIDEVQDLAGYDLAFLKLLFQSSLRVLLIGDTRQVTYLTHHERKHTGYKHGKIAEFIQEECTQCFDPSHIDYSMRTNYRCSPPICEFSNKLYPDMPESKSGNGESVEHTGLFQVKKRDVENYVRRYSPMQLRWNSRESVSENALVSTFGLSKGREFDRVLIYPTKKIIKWLKNNSSEFRQTSRSKFYVAITRARHSVAIVCDEDLKIDEISTYTVE